MQIPVEMVATVSSAAPALVHLRSAASNTGTSTLNKPRFYALPPRLDDPTMSRLPLFDAVPSIRWSPKATLESFLKRI